MHLTKPTVAGTLAAMAHACRAIWAAHRMELADWRTGQRAAAERHRSQPVPVGSDVYVPPQVLQPCAVPDSERGVVLTVTEVAVYLVIVAAALIALAYWVCDTDPLTFMQLLQVEPAMAVAIAELFGVAGR